MGALGVIVLSSSNLAVRDPAISMAAVPQLTQQRVKMTAPFSTGQIHEVPSQGQFLRSHMQSPMMHQAAQPVAQMQAYNPFNAKKYETLSYLPQLGSAEIKKQVDYMIKN